MGLEVNKVVKQKHTGLYSTRRNPDRELQKIITPKSGWLKSRNLRTRFAYGDAVLWLLNKIAHQINTTSTHKRTKTFATLWTFKRS